MFKPKGFVIVDKELKHTLPPPERMVGCDYNLKDEYFSAMQGKMLKVVDVAVDGSSYLVMAESPKAGVFMWSLDKRDTIGKMIPYAVISQFRHMRLQDAMKAAGMEPDAFSDEVIDIVSKAIGVDLVEVFKKFEVLP